MHVPIGLDYWPPWLGLMGDVPVVQQQLEGQGFPCPVLHDKRTCMLNWSPCPVFLKVYLACALQNLLCFLGGSASPLCCLEV